MLASAELVGFVTHFNEINGNSILRGDNSGHEEILSGL